MRTVPGGLQAYLDGGGNTACRADLVTLTLRDGVTVYRWTSFERPLTVGGYTYQADGATTGPAIRRGPMRTQVGLTVDTVDLVLSGAFTIGGKRLSQLAIEGYFAGARVQIDHLIMPTPGDVSLGALPKYFVGYVAIPDPQGPVLTLRLKSDLERMNVQLPRFLLQPQCGHAVYDPNCGLSRAAWTTTGATVASGSTTSVLKTTSASVVAKAADYYNLGVLSFTSGALAGTRRAVADFSVSAGVASITLAQPLASIPAVGDAFDVYPGCDRARATCATRFVNLSHYRGFPRLPRPESGA